MAVRGQRTKLKRKKPIKLVVKGNEGPPLGGTKRDGKVKSNTRVPIGAAYPPARKKIRTNWGTPIGGMKKVGSVKTPKVTVRKTK